MPPPPRAVMPPRLPLSSGAAEGPPPLEYFRAAVTIVAYYSWPPVSFNSVAIRINGSNYRLFEGKFGRFALMAADWGLFCLFELCDDLARVGFPVAPFFPSGLPCKFVGWSWTKLFMMAYWGAFQPPAVPPPSLYYCEFFLSIMYLVSRCLPLRINLRRVVLICCFCII